MHSLHCRHVDEELSQLRNVHSIIYHALFSRLLTHALSRTSHA